MVNLDAFFAVGNLFYVMLILVVNIFVLLWAVKVSAQFAYGRKVSYGQAAVQWLAIIFVLLAVSIIMFFAVSFLFALFT